MNMNYSLSSLYFGLVAMMFAGGVAFGYTEQAEATSHTGTLSPFTQHEIENNWQADRIYPSGGASSVSEFGRNDVARLRIDSSQTHQDRFFRLEGIKTSGVRNFGQSVQIDLYVDPDWRNKPVQTGFWVVGDTGTGERDNLFAIIEFVNLEPSVHGETPDIHHEGFRIFAPGMGWREIQGRYNYGSWATLKIELDPQERKYHFYIDGQHVGTGDAGQHHIRDVFLNSYNFGHDEFSRYQASSYAVHWHAGSVHKPDRPDRPDKPSDPKSIRDCMSWGWQKYGFKNQGQCIRYVNTGKDSRPDEYKDGKFEPHKPDQISLRDCSRDGWRRLGFSTQTQCYRYALLGQDSRSQQQMYQSDWGYSPFMPTMNVYGPRSSSECARDGWRNYGFSSQIHCLQVARTSQFSLSTPGYNLTQQMFFGYQQPQGQYGQQPQFNPYSPNFQPYQNPYYGQQFDPYSTDQYTQYYGYDGFGQQQQFDPYGSGQETYPDEFYSPDQYGTGQDLDSSRSQLPVTTSQCAGGAWRNYGFSSQVACVRFVRSG
jgi:hypothetical protein